MYEQKIQGPFNPLKLERVYYHITICRNWGVWKKKLRGAKSEIMAIYESLICLSYIIKFLLAMYTYTHTYTYNHTYINTYVRRMIDIIIRFEVNDIWNKLFSFVFIFFFYYFYFFSNSSFLVLYSIALFHIRLRLKTRFLLSLHTFIHFFLSFSSPGRTHILM